MTITLSTPALLFPAISLLFLSYTNRFLALSALIRSLHGQWTQSQTQSDGGGKFEKIPAQIENLRLRLILIKRMQVAGAAALVFCVLAMVGILLESQMAGTVCFGIALVLMGYSLIALVLEILKSGGALKILLDDAEDKRC